MRVASILRSRWGKTTSRLLVATMVVALPGGSWGAALGPPASAGGAASLTVTSEPPMAEVLIDGRLAGHTPADIRGLSRGEHKVTVRKEGHLENSRVVTVTPGALALDLRLTPTGDRPRALRQVEDEPRPQPAPQPLPQPTPQRQGGGGGKKWIVIAAGAAAVGGGAIFLLAKSNKPPIPGTIGVSPTGTGLMGATNFRFTSQGASDPENKPLTYTWNFGDGGSAPGASVSHVYSTEGAFTVEVVVSDGKKQASTSTTVNVRSLAGRWFFSEPDYFGLFDADVTLTQNGSSVSGTLTWRGGYSMPLSGSVSDVRRVSLGDLWGTATGTVNDAIDRIDGRDGVGDTFYMTRN